MLENPEAFEDSCDSGDSSGTPAPAPPAIQAIKQEDKSTYESAVEEEDDDEEDDYWDEEKEKGADSDGELSGRTQWGWPRDTASSFETHKPHPMALIQHNMS